MLVIKKIDNELGTVSFVNNKQKKAYNALQIQRGKTMGQVIISFVRNVKMFQDLKLLPASFNIDLIDDSSGMEETRLKRKASWHKASWHKSCRDLFNNAKLECAQKRKQADVSEPVSPIKAWWSSSSCTPGHSIKKCFFCDDTDSGLHPESTNEVDKRVRECATLLNDGKLLPKLSAGDMVAIDAMYHSKCLVSL